MLNIRCYRNFSGFLFIRARKPTYVGFLLESTRKGHLIPGAVICSIWLSLIFHYKFLSLKNPCPLDNRHGGRKQEYLTFYNQKYQNIYQKNKFTDADREEV